MPIFLFAKQIVDMLYQFQFMDYGMVLFAIVLLGYKIWKDKLYVDIRNKIIVTDALVVALGIVYFLSFLRYTPLYGTFFKVESCFLIYFLGRVYRKEIMNHGKMLAYAGYFVIYANFIYRFYQFGYKFILVGVEKTLLNVGGFYYYKTDLAFGILIATLFVYIFAKNNLFKWFTIIVISGYMVFYSGARMGQVVMFGLYVLIIWREYVIKHKKKLRISRKAMTIIMNVLCVCMLLLFIGVQLFPFEVLQGMFDLDTELGMKLNNLMHSRHIIWTDILYYFSEQNILTRLFGIDLGTEYLHTSENMRCHSQYIKQIYSTGYIGCFLVFFLVKKAICLCCDRIDDKMNFIGIIVWVAVLGFGFSIESLEATQMSWFPMLFLGALCSAEQRKQEVSIAEER